MCSFALFGGGGRQETSQYLVWPPFASRSATHLLRIEGRFVSTEEEWTIIPQSNADQIHECCLHTFIQCISLGKKFYWTGLLGPLVSEVNTNTFSSRKYWLAEYLEVLKVSRPSLICSDCCWRWLDRCGQLNIKHIGKCFGLKLHSVINSRGAQTLSSSLLTRLLSDKAYS